MELKDLELLLGEASRRLPHTEFVIVGSLSVLGVLGKRPVPRRMLVSIDVDCFTPNDPERIFELNASLGAGSEFEQAHGYYLDGVSPRLPTLPANWEYRLIKLPLSGGITARFLDPNDAAVSRYARGEHVLRYHLIRPYRACPWAARPGGPAFSSFPRDSCG